MTRTIARYALAAAYLAICVALATSARPAPKPPCQAWIYVTRGDSTWIEVLCVKPQAFTQEVH